MSNSNRMACRTPGFPVHHQLLLLKESREQNAFISIRNGSFTYTKLLRPPLTTQFIRVIFSSPIGFFPSWPPILTRAPLSCYNQMNFYILNIFTGFMLF